jgi:sugar phosphate isomerase/epimerase/nucleoside-diphosphate-sugar epimerase
MAETRAAIIGYTGFVGSHIKDHIGYECDLYNSKNIHDIQGMEYDIVYMAGMPATKWLINKEPEKDMINMMQLQNSLAKTIIHKIVLISTIDIYDKNKQLQDENIVKVTEESYGKHRFIMEEWVKLTFPDNHHIIRLPALFGIGLKKNIIYDMLNNNNINTINPYTFYQWYDLDHLISDINYVISHDIRVINLFSEPIWTMELVDKCFPHLSTLIKKNNCPSTAVYNYTTKYSPSLNGYAYQNKEIIFDRIKQYIDIQSKIYNARDRLVVSNIAWNIIWEDLALDVLQKYGINSVELAITKYADWENITQDTLIDIKSRFSKRGMTICSLQAVFFGVLFNVFTQEDAFTEHFKKVIKFAEILGAKKIVFGSPRNREKCDNISLEYANKQFARVMYSLAEYAEKADVIICIEPNAVEYKCNYINYLDHAVQIVKMVNHPNCMINYDTGNALMAGEFSVKKFEEICPYIGHIQVSMPFLDELRKVSSGGDVHTELSKIIKKTKLNVSLEMKQVEQYSYFLENIRKFVALYA